MIKEDITFFSFQKLLFSLMFVNNCNTKIGRKKGEKMKKVLIARNRIWYQTFMKHRLYFCSIVKRTQ